MKRYRSKKTRSNLFFHRAVRKGFVTFDSRILKEGREEMESWKMEVDRCRVDGTKFRESSRTTYRRTYVLVEASNRKYPITRIIIRIIDECIVNRSLSCVYIDLNTHLSRICLIFDYFRLITLIVSSLLTWILGLFSFFFYNILPINGMKKIRNRLMMIRFK